MRAGHEHRAAELTLEEHLESFTNSAPSLKFFFAGACVPSDPPQGVIEFPSFDQAKRWYNSPEYQAALSVQLRSAVSNAVIMEGYNP